MALILTMVWLQTRYYMLLKFSVLKVQQATLHLHMGQNSAAIDSLDPVLDSLRAKGAIESVEFLKATERAAVAQARFGNMESARELFRLACAPRRDR